MNTNNKVFIINEKLKNRICIYKNIYNQNENVIKRLFDYYISKSNDFENEKDLWRALIPILNKFSQGADSSYIEYKFKELVDYY